MQNQAQKTASIDEIMGFDGNSMEVFNQKTTYDEPTIYKTLPKLSKSDDGNYHSKVKIILNPLNPKLSVVPQTTYWIETGDSKRLVRSMLSNNDTNCPIFQCWRRNWKGASEERKNELRKYFQRTNSQWVIVQVLEDNNQPQFVGKFVYMKLAHDIYDKLKDLMSPSPESGKQPTPVMDYVVGSILNINCKPGPNDPANPERTQRETSYSLCGFEDYAPILKTDGTNLFSDDELDLIDTYQTALNDSRNGKTQKKKDDATAKLEELRPEVKKLYEKAIQYIQENLKDDNGNMMDLEKDCGYQEWDESTKELVNQFLEMVDAGVNPTTTMYNFFKGSKNDPNAGINEGPTDDNELGAPENADDLPF